MQQFEPAFGFVGVDAQLVGDLDESWGVGLATGSDVCFGVPVAERSSWLARSRFLSRHAANAAVRSSAGPGSPDGGVAQPVSRVTDSVPTSTCDRLCPVVRAATR